MLFIGYAGPVGGCADYAIADPIAIPLDTTYQKTRLHGRVSERIAYVPKSLWHLPTALADGPGSTEFAVANEDGSIIADAVQDSAEERGLVQEEQVSRSPWREFADGNEKALMRSKLVALANDTFVFCTYNTLRKAHAVAFSAVANILRRVPKSVWHVPLEPMEALRNVRLEAAAAGIDPRRILGLKWLDGTQRRHLAAKAASCQLFLDTPGYAAHATAADALWANVPILSLPGESWVGRISFSAMHALFHGRESKEAQNARELLTPRTYREYEDAAVRLASDHELLARVRLEVARARGSQEQQTIHSMFGCWKHELYISRLFKMMHELKVANLTTMTLVASTDADFEAYVVARPLGRRGRNGTDRNEL